jgi:hypothetical protein
MEIDFVKVNKCIKFSKVKKNNTYVADLGLAQHYLSYLSAPIITANHKKIFKHS